MKSFKEYILESIDNKNPDVEPFFWWTPELQYNAIQGGYNGYSEEFNSLLKTKVSKVRTISDVEKLIEKYYGEIDQKMMEHDIAFIDKLRSNYQTNLEKFVGEDKEKLSEIVGSDFDEFIINAFPYELIIKEIY